MSRLFALICMALATTAAYSEQHNIWAKGATQFGHACRPPHEKCTLARVVSPDHKYVAIVRTLPGEFELEIRDAARHDRLIASEKMDADMALFVHMEAFWAPDSSAISLAWNSSGITFSSRIYSVEPDSVRPVDLSAMRTAFARRFPPCVGDRLPCEFRLSGEDYNYLTVAWGGPHTAVLMAEVPSSSRFGANTGRVTGYELDARTGAILRRCNPKDFKRRWQWRMGWDFNVANASGG